MNRLAVILCALFIISACSQSKDEAKQTQIAGLTSTASYLNQANTAIAESWTKTPTLTSTPTPSFTPTSTVTITPTATPDLTTLGKPEKPFTARWKKPTYNEKDFDIIQKSIHGRIITIAWEKEANIPETKRNEISNFYFQTFINWWSIFQGFPYDSYTVVFKKIGNNRGEKGIGYEATASQYAQVLDGGLRERISHEVFHAWVENALCVTQERKFDDGLWFREGITQYYGDRGAGKSAFNDWIQDHWRTYKDEIQGTQYDIPLVDMPAKGKELGESPSGNNRHYILNVYWKGALVAYLMDERLIKGGLNLDDFLRYMYEKYTLKQRCFTTKDTIQALNEISGENWIDFFNAYIYGTGKLPLNGKFEYLDH